MELYGAELAQAISTTKSAQISIRDGSAFLGWLPRDAAVVLAHSGEWVGVGSPRTVRHMKPIPRGVSVSAGSDLRNFSANTGACNFPVRERR